LDNNLDFLFEMLITIEDILKEEFSHLQINNWLFNCQYQDSLTLLLSGRKGTSVPWVSGAEMKKALSLYGHDLLTMGYLPQYFQYFSCQWEIVSGKKSWVVWVRNVLDQNFTALCELTSLSDSQATLQDVSLNHLLHNV
jgi:hypothetical protein